MDAFVNVIFGATCITYWHIYVSVLNSESDPCMISGYLVICDCSINKGQEGCQNLASTRWILFKNPSKIAFIIFINDLNALECPVNII